MKVLDFGLARVRDAHPAADPDLSPTLTAAATQMGVILGTAAYMSPEQARGRPVDKRADVWPLEVVLYEMLTGRTPYPSTPLPARCADLPCPFSKGSTSSRAVPPTSTSPPTAVWNEPTGPLTRLTSEGGVDGFGTWAPDGDRVLYTSVRGERAEIYARRLVIGFVVITGGLTITWGSVLARCRVGEGS